MAQRRFQKGLLEWQRRLLLGLTLDDLDENSRFDALIDGHPDDKLLPVWQQHRERLLDEWRQLRGARCAHPMDAAAPRLPRVER